MDLFEDWCNSQVSLFMGICNDINFPVSLEKTEWATQFIIFLGILLNSISGRLAVPQDKVNKAEGQLQRILESKKVKVIDLQRLTGLLNFLCKAIFPGRAFTRRMYAKYRRMPQHYHVRVDRELRMDVLVWQQFLNSQVSVTRPFIDLSETLIANQFLFTTDASRNARLGMGGFIALTEIFTKKEFSKEFPDQEYSNRWFAQNWEPTFIQTSGSSIEVCELMAIAMAISLFSKFLHDRRIVIFCDNQAVMHMVNNSSSSCKKCMYLLRVITGVSLQHNVRYFCRYIDTKANILSDLLSRNRIQRFLKLAPAQTSKVQENLPTNLWPTPLYLWTKD